MEHLELADFTKYKFLSGITYSPNGRYACFAVHQADVEDNTYNSTLWVYRVDEDQCFQLTTLGKETSFIWLDNQHILFPGQRSSKDKERLKKGEEFTVFYKISINGGEASEAFRVPLPVSSIRQITTDKFLLTANYNPNRPPLDSYSEQDKLDELKHRKEERDYEVLEEIPYWFNGEGYNSLSRNRLYLFDSTTETWKALTDEKFEVEQFTLNTDKTKAVVIGHSYEGKMPLTNHLYMLDIAGECLSRLTLDEQFAYNSAHFAPDNKIICLGTNMQQYGLNENSKFYLVDVNGGERHLITPNFTESTFNSVGSDCRYGGSESIRFDGDYLYFVTTEQDSSYLNRLDMQGNIKRLTKKSGSVDGFDVVDGRVILIGMRDLKLQELYLLTDDSERQVTHLNDWVPAQKYLSDLEPISVETAPGVVIDGWVMKPVGFREGKSYPAILNIHGGPKTVYGPVFHHEMQYWANCGYFVFFCNPRGSDGKGNEFADIRGKYGTIDYDDLMQFTDQVLEDYQSIDRARVGVTGGSYGGYMTNWIIGHTDRFKAAASQRSISNWVSMGFTTDIGYFFVEDQIAATPWSDYAKLWDHSPLKYADQVRTPTLFIHSEEDYRCWLPEGLQMFSALKYHGVESRLCMFREENHELSRSGKPKHRIRRLEEITSWFDKYLQSE